VLDGAVPGGESPGVDSENHQRFVTGTHGSIPYPPITALDQDVKGEM
jgi:hypothetical protein